ncbi:uncharacterized protein LOC143268411 isoform X2 [Peromyscus maniculatus bairdii]|uniref:uncharacterized protein LOC143268411 isoform X2 n=1 Tax=Peromyscus maniculatus bairdii TaxID=230844 RepID=UPI003FD4A1E1
MHLVVKWFFFSALPKSGEMRGFHGPIEGAGFPESGVTRGCESLDMDTENQTGILSKVLTVSANLELFCPSLLWKCILAIVNSCCGDFLSLPVFKKRAMQANSSASVQFCSTQDGTCEISACF